MKYSGEIVYIFAFDLAYDMKRERIPGLLGQPVRDYLVEPDKRSPKQMFFYRPQMVTLPEQIHNVRQKDVLVKRSIKLFNVGAISIQIRIPFEAEELSELVAWHNIDLDGVSLEATVRSLVEDVLQEIRPFCIKPVTGLGQSENYTVFCIKRLPQNGQAAAEQWLMENRRQVAALLAEEQNAADLAEQIQWMTENRDACIEMGKNAHAEFEAKYTASRNFEMLMDIYHMTIARNNG